MLTKLCKFCSVRRLPLQWLPFVAVVTVLMPHAAGGPPFTTTTPGDIMSQYSNLRTTWTTNVWVYANRLFGFLAFIEFGWSVIALALDKTDLQSWTAGLIRKLMWIGAFYALLINGRTWIPAIIDSFEMIGTNAAAMTAPLSPGDVFAQGIGIAASLMDAADSSGFFTNPGSSVALVFSAIIIVISYTIIAVNFIVTMVESYLTVSAGFIFLGFGGSRWTAPYVERYIGLAVSIGVKIVLLYCLISGGQSLGTGWLAEAQGIGTAPHPSMTAFDVMGAAVIYMMLCWHIPKLFSAVLGGAPALTGGDLVSTALTVGGAGFAVTALSSGAVAAAAGSRAGSAAAGSAVGGAATPSGSGPGGPSVQSVGSANSPGASVAPPTRSTSALATDGSVRPPTSRAVLDALGGQNLEGSGFEGEIPAKGFAAPVIGSPPGGTAEQTRPGATTGGIGKNPPQSSGPSAGKRIASAADKADKAINALSRGLGNARRSLGPLSDAGPSASPPRMPIDHHE